MSQRVRQSSILRVATVGEDVMLPGDPRMKQLRRLGADFGSTDDLSSLSQREAETSGNGMQYPPESDLRPKVSSEGECSPPSPAAGGARSEAGAGAAGGAGCGL